MSANAIEILERVAARTVHDGECIVWLGAKSHGYGHIWIDGRHRPVHRIAYEAVHGPIPAGLQIDHLCRNPSCVRIDHLEAVTQRENIIRGTGDPAQNARKTHCKRGHPFEGSNVFIDSQGKRQCRTCYRMRKREDNRRRKERAL